MNRLVDYAITLMIALTVYVVWDRTSNADTPDGKYKLPYRLVSS